MKDAEVERVVLEWADEAVEQAINVLWAYSGEPAFKTDLVRRFRQGRARFGGDFDLDGTDWVEERREELVDAVIYSVFDFLKQKGGDC